MSGCTHAEFGQGLSFEVAVKNAQMWTLCVVYKTKYKVNSTDQLCITRLEKRSCVLCPSDTAAGLNLAKLLMTCMYCRKDNKDLIKGTNYTLHVTDVAVSMLAKIGAG